MIGSFVFIYSQSDRKQTGILGWSKSGYWLSLMIPLLKTEVSQEGKTVLGH